MKHSPEYMMIHHFLTKMRTKDAITMYKNMRCISPYTIESHLGEIKSAGYNVFYEDGTIKVSLNKDVGDK